MSRIRLLRPESAYNAPSGTGSDGGDGMEARIARLEAHMENVQRDIGELRQDVREVRKEVQDHRQSTDRDFRILFSALITAVLGLATIMAKGFGWIG